MGNISPADAMSVFGSSYLTVSQVHDWILYRDPEFCKDRTRSIHFNIKELQGVIAGEAPASSRSVDALQQLLAALEAGRVKATGRRNSFENPRSLPAHYWPRLTFTNDMEWRSGHETYACLKTNPRGAFWKDLLFGAKGVLTVWPPPTDRKQPEQSAEDGFKDECGQHHPVGMSGAARETKREPRPAPDSMIHKTISEAYNEAEKRGSKPPNVKEIVAPVQTMLRDKGYQASGRHIQGLAQNGMHKNRRRKPGATVASEKRQQHR
jgi:hypothetical protein